MRRPLSDPESHRVGLPAGLGWLRGRYVRLVAAVVLIGLLAWAIAVSVRNGGEAFDPAAVQRHPSALLIALVASVAASLCFAFGWIALVRAMVRPSEVRPLLSAFLASWLLRYIPGKLPALGVRVYLGRTLGYPARPLALATGIQVLLDIGVSVVAGALLVLLVLGAATLEFPGAPVVLVTGVVASGGAAFYLLRAVDPYVAVDRVLGRMRQQPLVRGELPASRSIAVAAFMVLAGTAANGIAVLALLGAFADATWTDAPLVIGAASLAGVAGIVIAIAPSGLGVREGALVALLATRFPPEAIIFSALWLRLIQLVVDVALASVGSGHLVVRGFRSARTASPLADPSVESAG